MKLLFLIFFSVIITTLIAFGLKKKIKSFKDPQFRILVTIILNCYIVAIALYFDGYNDAIAIIILMPVLFLTILIKNREFDFLTLNKFHEKLKDKNEELKIQNEILANFLEVNKISKVVKYETSLGGVIISPVLKEIDKPAAFFSTKGLIATNSYFLKHTKLDIFKPLIFKKFFKDFFKFDISKIEKIFTFKNKKEIKNKILFKIEKDLYLIIISQPP